MDFLTLWLLIGQNWFWHPKRLALPSPKVLQQKYQTTHKPSTRVEVNIIKAYSSKKNLVEERKSMLHVESRNVSSCLLNVLTPKNFNPLISLSNISDEDSISFISSRFHHLYSYINFVLAIVERLLLLEEMTKLMLIL